MEKKLIEIAKPYLDKCRPGDWNHALRVVKWIKILGKERNDLDLLITAGYLHDIGWTNVLNKEKLDFDEMLKYEDKANQNTPVYMREVLEKLNFSERDIITVIRLISSADKHKSELEDEEIIVDADNLSKLNIDHMKEKYSEDSYKKVVKKWEEELANRIKTPLAKEKYPFLLKELKEKLNLA